jgi:tetratricopeptide (TPR) repeat protein
VVTFDAPVAPTDQAGRAVRCALAVRKILPSAPIAVATGRAVVGNRAPVGAVVDRAIHALGTFSGKPLGESVRLDDVTAGLLGPRFDVRGDDRGLYATGEHEVDQVRTLLGKPTPCVGRDRELSLLQQLYSECAIEKVARAALVVGPPGQGKSRVRYEFLRHLREKESCEIVFGRADSLSAGATFGLLKHALRRICGLADGESLEVQRRKLRAHFGRHLHKDAERVVTFLGELCGVRGDSHSPTIGEALRAARADATLMGDAMQEAWESWLEAECRAQPVVLVLEDLQWGDLPTIRFVDRALRNLRDQPLFVLALARPEVYSHFPSLWAEREVQEIRLGGLTRRAAEKLVHEVLGEIDAKPIVDAADGNAFFLEELIRHVSIGTGKPVGTASGQLPRLAPLGSPIETGKPVGTASGQLPRLAPLGSPIETGKPVGSDSLPDSVLAMMQARFEALGQRARRILRAASIFGERFWLGGVKELAGDADLKESIDDLVERELIARRSQGALPDELVFRHALVRQAAYAMLTEEDRALGHRLAGEWLERAWRAASGEASRGPVDAVMLAEHFVLGRVPAHALPWYRLAAEQALEGNDFDIARERADKALACGAEGATLGSLRLIQAEAHAWSGKPADAETNAIEAASLLPSGGAAWFRAVDETMVSACRAGESAVAVLWARHAAEAEATPGAESQQVTCLARGALRLMFAGMMEPAAELVARLELLGDALLARIDRASAARVHELHALAAYYAGSVEGNLEFLEAAYAAYDQAGDARNGCQARVYLGFAYVELGQFVRAQQVLRDAYNAAERLGLRAVAANALHNLGWVLALLGNPQLGRETEERALKMFRELAEPRKQGQCNYYLGRIGILLGDLDYAERHAREALTCSRDAGGDTDEPTALAILARSLVEQGRNEEALEHAKAAFQHLESMEATSHEGEVRLMYAEALHAAGNPDALAAIEKARDRLLRRADQIQKPERRESFLTLVPENARTLRLAAEWGKDRF